MTFPDQNAMLGQSSETNPDTGNATTSMSKEDSEQVFSSKSYFILPIGIAKAYDFCISTL